MSGLPSRTGDPKDSEFGGANTGPLVPNGHVATAQATAPRPELPFSEFVACFLCGALLSTANQEGRKFWLTSCDHVLCSRHDHEKGRCTLCGKTEIAAYIVDTAVSPTIDLEEAERKLPPELQVFLHPGDQLFSTIERASEVAVRSAKALKYQNDQLTRTVRVLQKQLSLSREKASTSMAMLDQSTAEKAEWENEKKAMQSEIEELRTVVAVNQRPLPTAAIPYGMPSIAEEGGDQGGAGSSGKRQRRSLSPGLRMGPNVDRITLPPNAPSSHGSHSSSRSGPRQMEQARHALGQYRYQPNPEPQTPITNGRLLSYRPQQAAPMMASPYQQQGALVPAPPYPISTPGPVPQHDVVARLRQNGRSERDDSPSRPATAMATPYRPATQSPLLIAPGGPQCQNTTMGPHTAGPAQGYANDGYRPPVTLTRPHTGSRF